MHVVQCLTHSCYGGGQQVVYTLVRSLLQHHPDISITVVLPPGGVFVERFGKLQVRTIEMPLDRLSLIVAGRVLRTFRTIHPHVIHSHGKGAGLYLRLMTPIFLDSKFVHTFHGFHTPEGRLSRNAYVWLERAMVQQTDCLVSVSQSERDDIVRMLPGAKAKTTVIPNCIRIDTAMRNDLASLPVDVQSFIDRANSRFVITMIGRNDPVKNYPLAFQTARQVLQRSEQTAFVFVGIDPQDNGAVALRQVYPDRVIMIPSVDGTVSLIQRSDVLLLTSRKEGSPLVVLEAFTLGKPVVGTNVPGIRDLVVDRVNGLLCDENPNSLADAIVLLVNNRDVYQRLCENALVAASKLDEKTWSDQYYKLYKELSDAIG